MEDQKTMKRPDDNVWKIVLALICLGILGYGFFYSKNTIADLPFLVGYYFPITLVIWVVFYAALTRKRGAKIGILSFLVIFICMIGSGLIGYSQQKLEAKHALSEIQNQISSLIDSSTDSQGFPKRVEPMNTTPKARGQFGEIERFMKDFMNQMVSQRNDYFFELEAIGWNEILDANRIKLDKNLVESNVTIQKAKEVVKKYTHKNTVLLENTKEKIRSLNISESRKKEMLSGFDRGMEKAKSNIDAMWALEGKTINEFENIIKLLNAKKGAWVVESEQILFFNESDLETFNSYIASIQEIVNQQEQIQLQSAQTFNLNFDRLKK